MPFKIVQTIERGRPLLTAVPHEWENNGILFWPKKHEKLRRIENSKPETNWNSINCILKRSNLPSLAQAEFEIDNMSNASDTETDNENYQVTRYHAKMRNTSKIQENFNEIARECYAEHQSQIINKENTILLNVPPPLPLQSVIINSDITIPPSQNHTITENMNQESQIITAENIDVFNEEPTKIGGNIHSAAQVFMAKNCIVPPAPNTNYTNVIGLDDAMTLVLQKLDGMKQDIDKLFENQNKILFKLTQTSTQFEEFIKASCKQTKHENIPAIKPVSNLEELQNLEFMLRDPDFRAELKNKIDVLCSKGKNRGTNNAYALIDVLIQRSFLCQCSWAGGSKTESSKICLKSFTNIIDLFFSVIHESDPDFKKPDCEKFLKTVLKNSRQRLVSKQTRLSTTRCRQKVKTLTTACPSGTSISDNQQYQPKGKGKKSSTLVLGEELISNELPVLPKPQESDAGSSTEATVGPFFRENYSKQNSDVSDEETATGYLL